MTTGNDLPGWDRCFPVRLVMPALLLPTVNVVLGADVGGARFPLYVSAATVVSRCGLEETPGDHLDPSNSLYQAKARRGRPRTDPLDQAVTAVHVTPAQWSSSLLAARCCHTSARTSSNERPGSAGFRHDGNGRKTKTRD